MIYFDNAATSKPYSDIVDCFCEIEQNRFANPASIHKLGMINGESLLKCREAILRSFNLKDYRVIFTSSSSEALNLAIKGYCLKNKNRGNKIITSNIEHPAVLETLRQMKECFGFEVVVLPVSKDGTILSEQLASVMDEKTILVSIMAVNNEIGSINDISALAKVVHQYPKAKFLVDTTQAIAKCDIAYKDIDMFVVSAHKIHGLKGSGCLIIKNSISLLPLISGGGQEDGFRSGTSSLALCLSLTKTIAKSLLAMPSNYDHVLTLNNHLRNELSKRDDIVINSDSKCSPYIFNFSLKKHRASVVVEALSNKDIFVSSVSACHSKRTNQSYVVKAINDDDYLASNTIRISFSYDNTSEEIATFLKEFDEIMRTIK